MKQEPSAARQGIPVVHGREEVKANSERGPMSSALAALMFTAPVEVLNRQPGAGRNIVDHWWYVDSEGAPLFFCRSDVQAPQCNARREAVDGMYPGVDLVQLPRVFVLNRFHDGVLRPYIPRYEDTTHAE